MLPIHLCRHAGECITNRIHCMHQRAQSPYYISYWLSYYWIHSRIKCNKGPAACSIASRSFLKRHEISMNHVFDETLWSILSTMLHHAILWHTHTHAHFNPRVSYPRALSRSNLSLVVGRPFCIGPRTRLQSLPPQPGGSLGVYVSGVQVASAHPPGPPRHHQVKSPSRTDPFAPAPSQVLSFSRHPAQLHLESEQGTWSCWHRRCISCRKSKLLVCHGVPQNCTLLAGFIHSWTCLAVFVSFRLVQWRIAPSIFCLSATTWPQCMFNVKVQPIYAWPHVFSYVFICFHMFSYDNRLRNFGHFNTVSISPSVCQTYPLRFFCHCRVFWRSL